VNASFNAANQAKLALKMRLSAHAWYSTSYVENDGDEYIVVISVSKPIAMVKKDIPEVYEGVSVKTILAR
jgi:hypothetical protein